MYVCMYVYMYICTYVLVTLNDVNLQSHSRAWMSLITWITQGCQWRTKLRGDNVSWHGWVFVMYVFCGIKCRNHCWNQPTAGDSEIYAKTSVHHGSQTSNKTTRKSSKVESMYWRVSSSHILFFGLPLINQHRTSSDTSFVHPTHMRNVHRHTGAWGGARHHTHAYSYM